MQTTAEELSQQMEVHMGPATRLVWPGHRVADGVGGRRLERRATPGLAGLLTPKPGLRPGSSPTPVTEHRLASGYNG